MIWLLIVLVAHCLNALVFILTKVILEKLISNEKVFAILIGGLGALAFIVAPWLLQVPSCFEFFINILAGASFIFALYYLYLVLKKFDASTVVPISGATIPIVTLILAFVFLHERLGLTETVAFLLLVLGTVVITMAKDQKKFTAKAFMTTVWAGLLFAFSYFLTKYAFEIQDFWSAFIWMRAGSLLAAIVLIFDFDARNDIVKLFKKLSWGKFFAFAGTMVLAALAFVLLNYAFSLGSVTLANALQGSQYVLLVGLVIIGGRLFPRLVKEKIEGLELIQKSAGIILIISGIAILASSL